MREREWRWGSVWVGEGRWVWSNVGRKSGVVEVMVLVIRKLYLWLECLIIGI